MNIRDVEINQKVVENRRLRAVSESHRCRVDPRQRTNLVAPLPGADIQLRNRQVNFDTHRKSLIKLSERDESNFRWHLRPPKAVPK